MAYTFTDHYRPARLCLRVNAILIGLGLGLLLLVYPRELFVAAGVTLGSAWTARIGGGALIGLGIGLLAASMERDLHPAWLLAAIVGNGAIAISLLIAYFEGEMATLHPIGHLRGLLADGGVVGATYPQQGWPDVAPPAAEARFNLTSTGAGKKSFPNPLLLRPQVEI